ncbi:hypothetical protein HaLaN_16255 [Haematococcus lacustris]|uniref:Secreted protein n=1 Tax=Haematococcus lacustris TaxID=44745 RepID=A0A699Z9M0_HAELA|nr:hypothetical protein HaLaN_16255 [Haematococcus lacustris]
MLLEQRIAAALPFRVAYALLSLTSCWLLPWELVSQPLLDMLAEAKPHHAECALLRCHVLGKPLTARVLAQLSSLVQAEAWGRAHSLLPVEVHATNCSLTYRVLFTPTR